MIMKNFEVKEFGDFLYKMSLKGKQSRMRSRFINLIEGHLVQVNNERQQLVMDFAKKDDEGNPLTEDYEGKTAYVLNNPEEYNREIGVLMTEDFILEETQERLEMLEIVRDAVLEYGENTEMSGDSAMAYDRFCELVENVGTGVS